MSHEAVTRREMMRQSAFFAAAVAAMKAADVLGAEVKASAGAGASASATAGAGGAASATASAGGATVGVGGQGAMPMIKLGKLEVSRLILGSNPFFGFSHGNPQASAKEMKEFYTPEKIMAVLDLAAEQGITACWVPCYDNWVKIWGEYQAKGGKMKTWIAQPDKFPMEKELETAFKNGARGVCIQGMRVDDMVKAGKWDQIAKWIDMIHEKGLPAGLATHGAKTHLEAEDRKLATDFYHQTLYRPDNYVPPGLEESLATIAKLEKPVVAYKVLGAGRIAPKDQLPVVLKQLRRKDGICLGMFPKKKDEVAENAELTRKLTGEG